MTHFQTTCSTPLTSTIVNMFNDVERYTVDTLSVIIDVYNTNRLLNEAELSEIVLSRLIGENVPTYVATALAKKAGLDFANTTTETSFGITQLIDIDDNTLKCCEDF